MKLESEILLAQNAVEPVQNDSENHRDGENQSSAATETSEGSSANAESEDPNLVDNNEASSQDNEGPAEDLKQIDAQWNCEARASDVEPIVSLDNLYVGDTYLLHCEGDFVEGFATAEATLDFVVQEQSYTLKILKMRTFEAGEFWAEVTSYKPGEHKFDGVVITDSLQNIALSSEQPVVIKSALAERPQMEAMNPDAQKIKLLGPFPLALPVWVWIVVFGVLLGSALLVWRYVAQRMQKRRLLEELAKHNTALNPYNQFHKEIRSHIRSHTGPTAKASTPTQFVRDLDRSFRMFLVREFLIPAIEWKTSSVMSELKGHHRKTYRYAGPQVRKLLVEFDRAKEAGDKNGYEDCEQLIDMSRRVVNQIKKLKKVNS